MVKDIVESVESRISAPYFGYLVCSFLAVNWESLFYLFWSKNSVAERIVYFNQHTTLLSAIIFPVILGAFFTVASPYLKYWFAKIVEKPVRNKRSLDIMADEAAKRVRKDQEQKDQIEILEAKLKESEQAIETEREDKGKSEEVANKSIQKLTKLVEEREVELSQVQGQITVFKSKVKKLDGEKGALELVITTCKEQIQELRNAVIAKDSLQVESNKEIEYTTHTNKSLTEQLKRHQSKHSQYKNLSISLEELNTAMLNSDAISSDIMQNGPGEYINADDDLSDRETQLRNNEHKIIGLTEKIKVVKQHIDET